MKNSTTKITDKNPLLCDPETGICEVPSDKNEGIAAQSSTTQKIKPIQITYFTDPICSSCWGIEPQLKRLKLEYGQYFEIDYKMGGLLPSWKVYDSGGISKPADVAHHWDEVSLHYKMPIDGDVWLEDPLDSSYPPSIAFMAAKKQGKDKALRFLRKIREMVFLQKKNITKWAHLKEAATMVGLEVGQFKADYEGNAKSDFQQDLSLAKALGVRGFPTLLITNGEQQIKVYGVKPYTNFEQAILKFVPQAQKTTIKDDLMHWLHKFETLTTQEIAVLLGKSFDEVTQTMTELVKQKKATKLVTKNGVLWIAAEGK
ncbi:MAG TPA: dithiol-disulfide isomerase [Microscillaceae bacterium]|nr:dithiol-disulfide isomerase [Microscillaceae bacterium]